MGVSRPTLYAYLRNSDIRQLMIAEMEELRTFHMQNLIELLESKNPLDRRFSLKEQGVMIRHMEDKVFPKLLETRSLNITAKIDTQQRDRRIFSETLRRIPPELNRLFTATLSTVYKEYTEPQKANTA